MRIIILATALGLGGLALVSGQAPTNEDKEVRAAVDSYTAAFNKGDLSGLLALFADDAEYINEDGKLYKGKASLTELFKQSLANARDQKIRTTISSLHFLRPDVAMVDGQVDLDGADGSAVEVGRFTATWSKTDGKWQLSSVHDLQGSPASSESASAALQQLGWLVGDWSHDDPNFSVDVTARWTLNQSFLVLEYTVKDKDSVGLKVVQFFGWDPIDGVIRSWFFDSKGGYGGGDWMRTGNTWTASWKGVLSDGRIGDSISSIKYVDANSFLFRSVDREIDGIPIDDMETKFQRKTTGK
jgi:uncharacterized protein (TIGR02246 family)